MLAVLAGLDRRRFDPLLICLDGLGELADEAQKIGLAPIVVGRTSRIGLATILRLARLFRDQRVSIVHGWLALPSVLGRLAAVPGGVPVRVAAEGGVLAAGLLSTADRRRARAYDFLDRVLAPLTNAYVANSETVAAGLRGRGLADDSIVVIPNGVRLPPPLDDRVRARLRLELGAGPETALVGMVARIDPRFKDHDTFLLAVEALVREGRDARGVVVGDGPGLEAAQARARSLGIMDRVMFTGYRADASMLVAALDASVLLSYTEGFSNVVLETMAAGTPLVVSAIAPNREAVDDGVHGLLVPVRDADATVGALRRLLDDRGLAVRLGAAARERVAEHFSLEAQATATMQLYERLLAEQRRL